MTGTGHTFQSHIALRLEREPDGRALAFVDGDGRPAWRSFREYHDAAARCASVLHEKGLREGDVCVLVLSSNEFCANALLGILLVGAIPILVAPPVVGGLHSNLAQVVDHVIRTTSARMAIIGEAGRSLEGKLNPLRKTKILFGEDCLDGGDAAAVPLARPATDSIVAMQLTSGTTGFPRVCVWRQQGVLAALDGMEQAMALSPEDICVNWTPLYHDMGLVNNLFLCLIKRVPLVMLDTLQFVRKPAMWLRTLSTAGGTVAWSPNFGFALAAHRIRDQELDGVRLDHVRGFWCAAERIHLDTMRQFMDRFAPYGVRPSAMKTNFGCAENVGGATFSDANGDFVFEHIDRRAFFERGVARPVPEASNDTLSVVGVGRPYPGMRIDILSRTGRPLPDGHVGEIGLVTPSRMNGYLRNSSETKRALYGRYLRTGDFGYKRGNEIFWTGRVRERINIHGNKYDPSDFEPVLLGVPGLREGCFAAFGIDDGQSGTQKPVVVAEVRKSAREERERIVQGIRQEIVSKLGVTVNEVLLLPEGSMSKTSSGKRRHRYYKELYLAGELQALSRSLGA